MKNNKIIIAFLIIIPLVFLSVGIFQLYHWLRLFTFEQTKGNIINTNLKQAFLSQSGVGEYIPEINYSFNIDGKEYKGNKYMINYFSKSFEPKHGLMKWAKNVMNKYKNEDYVIVYYNIINPHENVLNRKLSLIPLLFIIVPLLFLALVLKFILPKLIEYNKTI